MNFKRLYFLIPAMALVLQCVHPNLSGPSQEGNGSETVAKGVIVDSMGAPAPGIQVQLLPASYNPVAHGFLSPRWRALTDAHGAYRIDSIGVGTYAVEARDLSSSVNVLIKGIELSGENIEVSLDTGAVRKSAAVIVRLPGKTPRVGDYVYLPGTTSYVVIGARDSAAGRVILGGIAAGRYADMFYVSAAGARNVNILSDGMTVSPGDTVSSAYAAWTYSKRIYLNTTATGAAIQGTVYQFPVLVRLTDSIFDFSQAKSGGADVRFVKPDGTALSYEIERWDAKLRRAEIWVKVDTIFGNNGAQWFAMYWGNPVALDVSNSGSVFDTANGFQGVWHFAEPAGLATRDATLNRYDGTPIEAAPVPAAGDIGISREFDGVSSGLQMKGTASGKVNFQQSGHYTISAWVFSDSLDEKWHVVVGKGDNQYYLKQQLKSRYGNWEFVEYQDKSGWQMTMAPLETKTWKHLTGVRDGEKQYLYLDGQMIDSAITQNYASAPRNTGEDITIGRYMSTVTYDNEGYCFFSGRIDEVRISSVVLGVDWIKLCYMNQRADDKLVVFK